MSISIKVATPRRIIYRRDGARALDAIGRAAARGAHEAWLGAQMELRRDMAGARLARLAKAVKQESDWRSRRLPRLSAEGPRFRVGAILYLKGQRNERTAGTFNAYSAGATIVPKRGRWLWIATDEIQAKVGMAGKRGRFRMTPARYLARGLDRRIGELEFIEGKNAGEAFLIVRDVTVDGAKGYGRARRRARSGNVPKGRTERDFIVAFIGIRVTRRSRRFNPRVAERRWQSRIPALIDKNLKTFAR